MQLVKQEKIAANSMKNVKAQEDELRSIKEKLEKEAALNKQLDESLQVVQKEIIEQKRKQSGTGGIVTGQERQNQIARQTKIIQNRLDKATAKYSEVVTKFKA